MRQLEKQFDDFTEIQFPEQAHKIYSQVTKAIQRREFPILMRSLYNIDVKSKFNLKFTPSNIFEEEKSKKLLSEITKRQKFTSAKDNWELKYIRIIEDNKFAYALFTFHELSTNSPYRLSLLRDMSETTSYYSWKLILP